MREGDPDMPCLMQGVECRCYTDAEVDELINHEYFYQCEVVLRDTENSDWNTYRTTVVFPEHYYPFAYPARRASENIVDCSYRFTDYDNSTFLRVWKGDYDNEEHLAAQFA